MGMRMPETCWAVFKWQVINLRICCIWLVDSVESMTMHGLANPKNESKMLRPSGQRILDSIKNHTSFRRGIYGLTQGWYGLPDRHTVEWLGDDTPTRRDIGVQWTDWKMVRAPAHAYGGVTQGWYDLDWRMVRAAGKVYCGPTPVTYKYSGMTLG
jgi:hypothetical protein